MTIRERIKEVLVNSGKKQTEIAHALGITQANISNYIRCKQEPTLDTLKNLCIYLDVSADYILGIKEY